MVERKAIARPGKGKQDRNSNRKAKTHKKAFVKRCREKSSMNIASLAAEKLKRRERSKRRSWMRDVIKTRNSSRARRHSNLWSESDSDGKPDIHNVVPEQRVDQTLAVHNGVRKRMHNEQALVVKTVKPTILTELPTEIIIMIAGHLNNHDLARFARVCPRFNGIIFHTTSLWEIITVNRSNASDPHWTYTMERNLMARIGNFSELTHFSCDSICKDSKSLCQNLTWHCPRLESLSITVISTLSLIPLKEMKSLTHLQVHMQRYCDVRQTVITSVVDSLISLKSLNIIFTDEVYTGRRHVEEWLFETAEDAEYYSDTSGFANILLVSGDRSPVLDYYNYNYDKDHVAINMNMQRHRTDYDDEDYDDEVGGTEYEHSISVASSYPDQEPTEELISLPIKGGVYLTWADSLIPDFVPPGSEIIFLDILEREGLLVMGKYTLLHDVLHYDSFDW